MSATIAPVVGEATVQELREAVRGDVFAPDDVGYLEACRVWNGMFDGRRPALVVRCTGAADVIAAVGFARSNDLPLAVRGGGHSIAGFSTCDGGLVVDLSAMRGVRVDVERRVAHVGGGATWSDVDHETLAHGLATTGGVVSSTGVGGYTLGGGIGWLMRRCGLACDNLIGADVVTADGQLIGANEETNAELLWGLRGGGGNFGVVTRLELALHPMGPLVHAGPIFYAPEDAVELMRLFGDWSPEAPDEVTAVVALTTAPPLPVIPEAWHGRRVAAFIACSTGSHEEADARVRPFRELGQPIADLLGPMPYPMLQTLFDPFWEKGIHSYFKATNLSGLDEGLIDLLAALHLEAPGPQADVHIHQMGGAVARVPEHTTAFPERGMAYVLNTLTGWHDPSLGEAHVAWNRAVIDAASGAETGRVYVNYLGEAGSARDAYGEETYERLVALKREYDPTNVFRLNQNIQP
jgi:FAD/FMN-containing dehydrogenase